MVTQDAPSIRILRLLEPNLETNCVELLDINDSVELIERSQEGFRKATKHFPIIRIPSYSNDVLLGESLQIAFVLGNNTKTKFSDVFLRVEMVMEHRDTYETFTIFNSLELEPKCKPLETRYTYMFKEVSAYRMTCTVEYSSLKGPLILKKMFIWHCINPVQLSHTLMKLPDGSNYLETRVKNKSKTLLILKELELENKTDSVKYSPSISYNKDNICLLRPEETYSFIFQKVQINYRTPLKSNDFQTSDSNDPPKEFKVDEEHFKKDTTDTAIADEFYLNINWHSYTNISGTNVSKVEAFSEVPELVFKVVDFPKNVKANEPFNLNIFLKNLTRVPLDVSIKFKKSDLFILQMDHIETVTVAESKTVSIPLIALATGLHHLDGLELHFNDKRHVFENLHILVK